MTQPGWLEQVRPGSGAVLLRDYPDEVVRIARTRCDRAGRYRLAALIARFGPAAGLPEVLATLAADCLRRRVGEFSAPCGARFPDLVG